MAEFTAEQFKDAARKAYAAGDVATARKLINRAKAAETATLPRNMAAAQAARAGTLAVSPESVRRANEFNEDHGGDLYDATHMGRMDALGRGALQGLTFGFGDEMVAALRPYIHEGETYEGALEGQRAALTQAREDRPGYAYGGEIAGAVASPVNMVLPVATTRGGLGARAASGARAAGTGGAIYGAGTGEGGIGNRAINAGQTGLLGAGVGAAIPVIGAGVQKVADKTALRQRIAELLRGAPSTEALRTQGQAAYRAIDDAGVQIAPEAARRGLAGITDDLMAEGVALDKTGKVFPGARAIVDAAQDIGADGAPVPFGELDVFRRFAGNAAGANPANKADTRLATRAVTGLDDMVGGLTPADVTAGDLSALQTALPKARDIWARMSRSQKLEDAIAAGDNYLSGPASGIRNQFSRILKNPKLARGFSEAEKAVMRRAAQGSLPEQALHLAGGGIGNIVSVLGGAGMGGVPGALLGTAGAAGLRKASEAVVRRNAEVARAIVASGGLQSGVKASPAARNAIEALLMRALRPTSPVFGREALGMKAR